MLVLIVVVTAVIGAIGQEDDRPEASGSSLANTSTGAESPTTEEDVLLATVTQLGNGDDCRNFVFDDSSADAADAILEDLSYYASDPEFVSSLLTAGAYLVGSVSIYFTLQTDLPQQVTVTGIRAEIVTEIEAIDDGTFIEPMPCGAHPIDQMHLLLNAPNPGPYAVEEETGERTDHEFFQDQVINVAPGDKQSVMVKVYLDPQIVGGAYEYRLVVDYEVDGVLGSVTIDHAGAPFRMSELSCDQDRFFGQSSGEMVGEGDPGYVEIPMAMRCEYLD
ncbi:hypothetical protein [Glycomyces algeriensis]|uniref:Uncharacterized protein n=1 Tax=Glycomyces algeriensis TaxID=256037 RepID=A0A9W6GA39_9ACTN|nr:hypothetical protein [Glycomyces algeriensis]MDA1365727.1 hypothetical protein [Glycomyces algeriensis]MDR7351415.1 hypothetical protein [Glycomyces algeriensis]GLI44135.1 hypothetical protein GALLR39Z86_39850 [Glycomyces algeriensis]